MNFDFKTLQLSCFVSEAPLKFLVEQACLQLPTETQVTQNCKDQAQNASQLKEGKFCTQPGPSVNVY